MKTDGDKIGKIVEFPDAEGPELEAALWLGRVEDGLNAEQTAAWRAWRQASPDHERAWREIAGAWDEAAIVSTVFTKISAYAPRPLQALRPVPQPSTKALVAGWLFLLAFVVLLGLNAIDERHEAVPKTLVTRVGEQHTIELPDGSWITLNTATQVHFSADDQERTLELTQGEVFLDVAKDPDHPFRVKTSAGTILVTGTAFSVYLKNPQSLEVVVEEGEVEVTPVYPGLPLLAPGQGSAPTPAATVAVRPGSRAFLIKGTANLESLTASEIKTALSWRDGLVMFTGEPLEEVVQHVGRYTDIDISISDPAIASLPIGGHFRVGEVNALLASLEMIFGISAQASGPKTYTLGRKAPQDP